MSLLFIIYWGVDNIFNILLRLKFNTILILFSGFQIKLTKFVFIDVIIFFNKTSILILLSKVLIWNIKHFYVNYCNYTEHAKKVCLG